MTITLIGAGNVATSLAPALIQKGHTIKQIFSRHLSTAQHLAATLPLPVPCTDSYEDIQTESDCYIYCLTDNALPEAVRRLNELKGEHLSHAMHLHTAGSVPLSVFPVTWERTGILYPFNSFSRQVLQDFANVTLLIEANNADTLSEIRVLAQSLSPMVYEADSEQRGYVHLAGNIANCFTNCLADMAREQLERAGLPFEIILPVMHHTVDKLHRLTPREAQTGPAARRDTNTMNKHLQLLTSEKDRQIYTLLTEKIISYT